MPADRPRRRIRPPAPATTASLVAAARVLHASVTGSGPRGAVTRAGPGAGSAAPEDPTIDLLPPLFALPVRAIGPLAGRLPPLGRLLRTALAGWVDHIAERAETVDAMIRDAIGAGAEQVVILGSGLDTRALRMPELAGLAVFEVDRPATLLYKARRLAARGYPSGRSTPVPARFGEDPLRDRLADAGFDPGRATVWVCEGVTVYLTAAVVRSLVAQVGGLSAPGSRLILTYVTPADRRPAWFLPIARAYAALVGEPFRGLLSYDDVRGIAAAAGLTMVADLGRDAGPTTRPVLERTCVLARDGYR